MSRRERRALGRLFRRPEAKPDPELAALRARLEELESKHDKVPGVVEGRKDWFVLVGGETVALKAMPPVEWMRTLEQLPGFLFAFAMEKVVKPQAALSDETVNDITEIARRWIAACAVDQGSGDLDRLTLPEAQHAIAHIAELNGVTAYMRAWFRERLAGVDGAASDGAGVRDEAERPPGDLPN